MNRPTIDVDDLLEMANEAIAEGDFVQAVTILRKATTVAPLRKDIRNRLAIALEGTPVPRKGSQRRDSSMEVEHAPSHYETSVAVYPSPEAIDEVGSREAISLIAKKAFDAAAGQTARAGVATRNLTNLLHQGIQTWKSSLNDVTTAQPTAPRTDKLDFNPGLRVSDATQAGVFGPETDLESYLNRANPGENLQVAGSATIEIEDDDNFASEGAIRLTRPTTTASKKSAAKGKASARNTDVEDVLAAGIDGFIEVLRRANKQKILFGIVYVALGALFSYACFDVSKKFPAVDTIPGSQVQTASLGTLNLSEATTNGEAISSAKRLAAEGNAADAINILKSQLESGSLLKNRDQIRIELATILNKQAEKHLTNNRLRDSVAMYREALQILPADAALQLRLANALYYMGTLGDLDETGKSTALSDAEKTLKSLASKAGDNLQTHRLLGLVHEAQGDKSQAKAAWQKVSALAPSSSSESKEATSHLK